MTENLAGRGERLAGLVDWLREQSEELMKSAMAREATAKTMLAATPKELREAKALAEKMAGRKLPNVSTGSEETKIEADVQCRIATKLSDRARKISAWADEIAALEAAAPPSTPAKGTGFVVSGEPLSEAESRWLKASAAALATPSPQAPRKWGAEIAARAEFGDLSPTSAREQSSATASFRLGVLLTDKIWQLRERGKELAKNPQEYFRGLADGFESLANELEALARPSVGEQK